MVLKKREKILLGVTSGLALAALVYWLLALTGGSTSNSLADLRRQRSTMQEDLDKKRTIIRTAAQNTEKMLTWEKQSLPASDAASTAYETWLRQLLEKVKFHNPTIAALAPKTAKNVYTAFPFRVNGEAGLEQVTRFLYEFYAAPHLHQVRRLSFQPLENSKEFKITILIDAVSLPTADRREKLAEGRAKRLAHEKIDDYLKMIVRRQMEGTRYVDANGVFTPYAPAPPPPVVRRDPPRGPPPTPPKPPGFDHKSQTFVDAIVAVDGKPTVWIIVRTTGKQYQLPEGGTFEVGDKRGVVRHIGPYDVELEIDGQRRRVTPGSSFAEAAAAPKQPSTQGKTAGPG